MKQEKNSNADAENEEVIELRLAIEALMDYLENLQESIDCLTQELKGFNLQAGNGQAPASAPMILTSMPLDPAAKDWQINRHSSADLPKPRPPPSFPRRQTLFD